MKAVVYTQYGAPDVLRIKEVAKPTPKDDEVLVQVRATAVQFGDIIARKFNQISPQDFHMPFLFWLPARIAFGLRKPKNPILGSVFAGEIEGIGRSVTRFKLGDKVFGYRGALFGANAEYMCVSENGILAPKPDNMSYEEAACVPYGALTALSLLRKVTIQPGQKVLINGASGAIGSHALQLAKHFGAEVTGVCSTPMMEFVKALGADKVIDYTQHDFTKSGETYDLIFDVLGKSSFACSKRALKPNGVMLYASFKIKQVLQMIWTSRIGDKKVICALSNESPQDLLFIKQLVEAGKIRSIIDRCYALEQTPMAHSYVETGGKTGNVVISIGPNSAT
jgi:NADPH:quinone reductase-like Zn-dependent oxidoreductase